MTLLYLELLRYLPQYDLRKIYLFWFDSMVRLQIWLLNVIGSTSRLVPVIVLQSHGRFFRSHLFSDNFLTLASYRWVLYSSLMIYLRLCCSIVYPSDWTGKSNEKIIISSTPSVSKIRAWLTFPFIPMVCGCWSKSNKHQFQTPVHAIWLIR